ncbi:MAG: bacteriochlorophyll 4-vinyl reductase [Leptolyngbya sp. SIO1D8]|nr:bacteriochlorophyll 4-vinyl reductase [Leptolyngbya sp. SIO1D8]
MARIGPNAILQLVPVLDGAIGTDVRAELLEAAGIAELPDGTHMIDEAPVARLHQTLRHRMPELAPSLSAAAGSNTGDYILANRIPRPAQRLLEMLPAWLGARLLASAIARHAWTFAGSGTFRVVSQRPLVFEIADNPVVRGERSASPVCAWHAAVFERLYRELIDDRYRVQEVACGAAGAEACRFELVRRPPAPTGWRI